MSEAHDPAARMTIPQDAPVAHRADSLLRVPEICRLLSVSKSTVYRMVEQNQLPHIRIAGSLRFRQHSILQWLSGQEKLPLPADSAADKAG